MLNKIISVNCGTLLPPSGLDRYYRRIIVMQETEGWTSVFYLAHGPSFAHVCFMGITQAVTLTHLPSCYYYQIVMHTRRKEPQAFNSFQCVACVEYPRRHFNYNLS